MQNQNETDGEIVLVNGNVVATSELETAKPFFVGFGPGVDEVLAMVGLSREDIIAEIRKTAAATS